MIVPTPFNFSKGSGEKSLRARTFRDKWQDAPPLFGFFEGAPSAISAKRAAREILMRRTRTRFLRSRIFSPGRFSSLIWGGTARANR